MSENIFRTKRNGMEWKKKKKKEKEKEKTVILVDKLRLTIWMISS
jgi:hypothetical protein